MKNKCVYLIALVVGILFYSCNNILEDQNYSNEQDYENLKSSVLAFAEANGVKVYIQEEVWKKNLPSLESIKKTILETKNYARDSKKSNKLQAKYNSPTRLKTGWEIEPEPVSHEGSFIDTEWILLSLGNAYCELEVDYSWGGSDEGDYVNFSGTADSPYYNDLEVIMSDDWYVFYDTRFLAGCDYDICKPNTFPKVVYKTVVITVNYNYAQGFAAVNWDD